MPSDDLLVALGIVEAERVREAWSLVGMATAAAIGICLLVILCHRFREPLCRFVSFLARPANFTCLVGVVALVVYAAEKADVKIPQTHQSDFRQTTSSLVEPVSGTVEYWQSNDTTNGVLVALFGGSVTQAIDFVAGQFVYAFDSSTSASVPQGLPGNKLWCRPAQSSNWVATTTHSYLNTNGHYSAAVASLPGNKSPAFYQLWFVGPEENLPPIIVEVTGGIDILNYTITSSSVSVTFKGMDERFLRGSHVYYFQSRMNRDGVITEWENVASVTLSGGQTVGTIIVNGYTVDKFRQYRVYSDLEVVE